MNPVNSLLDSCRSIVRGLMGGVANGLDNLSGGKISPNMITVTGLLAHIPIAGLIALGNMNLLAAGLLVIFGLFDTLDGALARLQKRDSSAGMLLDATTDRMKEVILYIGIAWGIMSVSAAGNQHYAALTMEGFVGILLVVAACGGSLLVSYVKAKGETAVAGKIPANEANRLFQDGLARFEIRMAILVVGLLANGIIEALLIITVLSWFTAIGRLIRISRSLKNV